MRRKRRFRACELIMIARNNWICLAFILVIGCGAPAGPRHTLASPATHSTSIPTGANLGYIWRSSDSTVRAISGVPGSAHIEEPMFAAHKYRNAAASVRSNTILLEDGNGNLWMYRPKQDVQPQELLSGFTQPSQIVFAPSGDPVVVFAQGSNRLIQVTGLSGAPRLSERSLHVPGSLSAAAPSDDGTLLLAYKVQDGSVSIASVGADGSVSSIVSLSGFGGMSFLRGKSDALVADNDKNVLYLLHLDGANFALRSIASAKDGLSKPSAVAASFDNRWAAVINENGGRLIRIDISGKSQAQSVQCICVSTELTPLAGEGVFQLNSGDSSPVWLADLAANQPKLFFIPFSFAQPSGTKEK